MFLYFTFTHLTLHVTTPMKFTKTAFRHDFPPRFESSSATKQVTPVYCLGCFITESPSGSEGSSLRVRVTVIRGGLEVHEVILCVVFELTVYRNQDASGSDAFFGYFSCPVEFFLEVRADLSECWHCSPTCLEFTGSGYAVTFTLDLHVILNYLEIYNVEKILIIEIINIFCQ